VQEVRTGLVHMTRINPHDWSYTLTRIDDGLWHIYGVKYDFWSNYETQTAYYVLLEDLWKPMIGYGRSNMVVHGLHAECKEDAIA
jgi:hypothetical protein